VPEVEYACWQDMGCLNPQVGEKVLKTEKQCMALIEQYIRAKDQNKPHLMSSVFTQDALLEIDTRTDVIDFPGEVRGLEAITKTLVTDFNTVFENIYTFCPRDSLKQNGNVVVCCWQVVMSDKTASEVRYGSGVYRWVFSVTDKVAVEQLSITIEQMEVLEAGRGYALLQQSAQTLYPWGKLLV